MARKQETKKYPTEDGDVEITLMKMGGIDASKLGIRLGGLLGPSVISLFIAADAQSAQAGADAGRLIFEKLTPKVFEDVLKEMLAGAQIKTSAGEFEDATLPILNDEFAGAPASIYRLTFDLVRMNFRNFLQGLGISSATTSKLEAVMAKHTDKVLGDMKSVKA